MELNEIYKTVRSMHSGELYLCDDENLVKEQTKQLDLLFDYNALRPSQQIEKTKLLKKMFSSIGEGCYIETPFHANWGGKFVKDIPADVVAVGSPCRVLRPITEEDNRFYRKGKEIPSEFFR